MSQYDFVSVDTEFRPGVAKVLMDRPEQRNAMNPGLHREMTAALEELRYDPDVKVVVITGAGGAFSAGMDIKEMFSELRDDPQEFDRITRIANEWRSETLRYYPKPIISMVNGYCFGGAISIVEGSDIAVAADEAKFGISEINFGSLPAGTVSKSMAVGISRANALLYGLSGRAFDGREAARIGLVAYSVPLDRLESDVGDLAEQIATKDAHALTATKQAYRMSENADWHAALMYTSARVKALKVEQAASEGGSRDAGVARFVKGDDRPGLR